MFCEITLCMAGPGGLSLCCLGIDATEFAFASLIDYFRDSATALAIYHIRWNACLYRLHSAETDSRAMVTPAYVVPTSNRFLAKRRAEPGLQSFCPTASFRRCANLLQRCCSRRQLQTANEFMTQYVTNTIHKFL